MRRYSYNIYFLYLKEIDILPQFLNDFQLAQNCLSGVPSAWEEFIKTYAPFASSIIRKTAESFGTAISSSDCEDVLHDIFLDLIKKDSAALRSYQGNSTLATWLRRVVSNKTINHLRKRSLKSKPLECLPSASEASDNSTKQKELRIAVKLALDKLPDRDRLVVTLYYFENKKYREIAEILNIPVNSVGPIMTRAVSVIKDNLEPGGK